MSMFEQSKPEAMIFDLDGTLFQTETLLLPAYHSVFAQLRKEGLYTAPVPPEERILSSLGLLLEHIWQRVIPDAPVAVHNRANELLLHYQLEGLRQGKGELYPRVRQTLEQLHGQGIRLFVASNGLADYVEQVIQFKGLNPMFEAIYSAGRYHTRTKVELVRQLLQKHTVRSAWMIGDRSSDVEAGRENGLAVIGCDYAGFQQKGELDKADQIITDFEDLLELVHRL